MNSGWRSSAILALALCAAAAPARAQSPGQFPQVLLAVSGRPPRLRTRHARGSRRSSSARSIAAPSTRGEADQISRNEDAKNKQQADLDRLSAQARRLGCSGGGFFSLFSGQNPQCTPLTQQIQQSRANLEKLLADLDRMQGGAAGDREAQRQTVIAALAQNNCGPQYRAAANQQRGFFDTLFGGNRQGGGGGGGGLFSSSSEPSGTFRTLCVRTCDGYYFPISYATTSDHFAEDAQTCQATCPAAETVLMSTPTGADVNQATASNGALYTAMPNAFKYRTEFNAACGCRKPGQSWAQALGQVRDNTLQTDDIVVTPDRAKSDDLATQTRDSQGSGRVIRTRHLHVVPAPRPQPPLRQPQPPHAGISNEGEISARRRRRRSRSARSGRPSWRHGGSD